MPKVGRVPRLHVLENMLAPWKLLQCEKV